MFVAHRCRVTDVAAALAFAFFCTAAPAFARGGGGNGHHSEPNDSGSKSSAKSDDKGGSSAKQDRSTAKIKRVREKDEDKPKSVAHPKPEDREPTKTTKGGGTPPATGTAGNGNNKAVTTTSVGPARPTGTGGDTVKTGGSGPSPTGSRDGAPALAPAADAATTDETARKRTTTSGEASAQPVSSAAKAAEPPATRSTSDAAPKTVSAAPTLASPAVSGASTRATIYSHNNSTMKFVPDNDTVRVVYDKPRSGLDTLGIKSGTPLFEGKKTGPNTYAGEATTFSRNCGAAKFPVAGEVDGANVTLRGQKPVRGADCNVSGYTSETLVFQAK